MSPGRFLVVEGVDGAGKSTLVAALERRLRDAGCDPVVVREPGGTRLAEALRWELLHAERPFEPGQELLYITAARADLVHHVIRPALEAGRLVLSDRFDLSTRAYQAAGRGLDMERVEWLNRLATGGLAPGLTLVLDLPAGVGRTRQQHAGKSQDRLDREDPGFQERVAACYRAANGPGVRHLDADRPPELVVDAAWEIIAESWPELAPGVR